MEYGAIVLHYDRDYDLIAQVGGPRSDHRDAVAVRIGDCRASSEEHPDDLDLISAGLGRSARSTRCDREVQRG
jgi:hypothetical protein